jgi:predicted transcriptional regulator
LPLKVIDHLKLQLKILDNEASHLDELVRISGGKTPEISARLTIMEMKGMVRNLDKGMYKKI